MAYLHAHHSSCAGANRQHTHCKSSKTQSSAVTSSHPIPLTLGLLPQASMAPAITSVPSPAAKGENAGGSASTTTASGSRANTASTLHGDRATGTATRAAGSAEPAARKRRARPMIDFDEHIREARSKIKDMGKALAAAKANQRNERRKKQRLVRKAATLSAEDLERIAVLKRCGLWTEHTEASILVGGASTQVNTAASSSSAEAAVTSADNSSATAERATAATAIPEIAHGTSETAEDGSDAAEADL